MDKEKVAAALENSETLDLIESLIHKENHWSLTNQKNANRNGYSVDARGRVCLVCGSR